MYKTVRHGENSLQYKILAQQEEGLTNVRCEKASRTVPLRLFTLTIFLTIGIVITVVLIPLVLRDNFFTLAGTFQKFSVSTLRRTHSGNHVVVIAKKPFGWNAVHPSASAKVSNTSQNHLSEVKAVTAATNVLSTNKATSTIRATFKTTTVETTTKRTTQLLKETTQTTFDKEQTLDGEGEDEASKFQPTPTTEDQKNFKTEDGTVLSTSRPVWFEPVQKWEFRFPGIHPWKVDRETNPLYVFMIAFTLVMIFVLLMLLAVRHRIAGRRAVIESETGESREDKASLLKPSARCSDEE